MEGEHQFDTGSDFLLILRLIEHQQRVSAEAVNVLLPIPPSRRPTGRRRVLVDERRRAHFPHCRGYGQGMVLDFHTTRRNTRSHSGWKVHDMTFMSCNPEFYKAKGASKHHRSCASNIAEVMRPHGMNSHLEVTDPFNICWYTLH